MTKDKRQKIQDKRPKKKTQENPLLGGGRGGL
jgi:hypothetical protein